MKIERGKTIIEDTKDSIVEVDGRMTCGCGNPSLRMQSHIDGVDFYTYTYQCENCGNIIYVEAERDQENG